MADYKVGVGVDVDFGELSKLKSEIKSLENKSIKVNVDLSDASIKNIQSIMGRAVDSKTANNMFAGVERAAAKSATSVSKTFTGVFGKDIDKQLSAIEKRQLAINNLSPGMSESPKTYTQMRKDLTEIAKLSKEASKLDFSKNAQEIGVVETRIKSLVASYKGILEGEVGKNLAPGQKSALNNIIKDAEFSLDRIKAKSKDAFNFDNAKAGISQAKADVSELVRIINEKAKLNIDLSSLDKADEKAKVIEARLKALSDRENVLHNRSLGSFNDSQFERIAQAQSKANSRVALAKAGNIDGANLEQTKIAISQLKDIINQIGNQRIKLLGLDETSKDADEARAKLAALEAQAEKMQSSLGKTTAKQDASITSSLDKMERRVAEEKEKIARSISKNVGAKDYGTLAKNYMREIDSLNNGSERLKQKGKELQNLAVDISTANSMMEKSAKGSDKWNYAFERANAARKEFQKTEAFLKNDISQYSGLKKQAEEAEKAALAFDNLNLKKTNFYDSIDVWRKNHSAVIGTDFDTQLTNIQNRIQDIDSPGSLNNLKAEFAQVTNQAQLADKATLNVGDRIKNQLKQYATYFGLAGAMMVGSQGIRSMFNNTLQVDTQMTELRRVTDLSESQYTNLFSEMTASAQQYGVALSDIISATADWSRAGFDANTSKQLAEITTMYQHVSDLDYDEAAQNLLTSYKGFEKQLTERYNGDATQAVGHIGDILNELDNKYAVTAAGVGEGLKRSASALDVANNTLEESAAMVAGASEVTQDPEKAGNALKVVSMRLRGMKGELEELGEDTDENVENLSKMQGQIFNLTGGHTNIFDSNGEFKSTYDILNSIAEVWDDIGDTDQAELLETVAGKNAYQNAQKCA